MILDVVCPPGLHRLFVAELEVSVTLPPAQNVIAPLVDIVGVAGNGFTVTVVAAEVALQLFALVTLTE